MDIPTNASELLKIKHKHDIQNFIRDVDILAENEFDAVRHLLSSVEINKVYIQREDIGKLLNTMELAIENNNDDDEEEIDQQVIAAADALVGQEKFMKFLKESINGKRCMKNFIR